jgi:hypothetical protein
MIAGFTCHMANRSRNTKLDAVDCRYESSVSVAPLTFRPLENDGHEQIVRHKTDFVVGLFMAARGRNNKERTVVRLTQKVETGAHESNCIQHKMIASVVVDATSQAMVASRCCDRNMLRSWPVR